MGTRYAGALIFLFATNGAIAAEQSPGAQIRQSDSAAQAAKDGVVQYSVNLDDLPGAQTFVQAGARGDDGRCTFTDEGSGQASGHGRVLVFTELSFDPGTCVRELARAEYAREAVPASVAAKLELPASSGRTAEDAVRVVTPGRPSPGETGAAAVREYVGSLKVNVEDPPQRDVTTTKSDLRWSNTGSRLNASHHQAHWGWFSPTGWRRTNAHWSYDNNGTRALHRYLRQVS